MARRGYMPILRQCFSCSGGKRFEKCFLSSFFAGFNPVLHIMIAVGPHFWLCSYSSQALKGYKLKAECLFLICLARLFLCIAIFGISLEVLIRMDDAWRTYDWNRNKRRTKESDNDKTEYQ